jgi:flagellar biosynthesis/type III secretory pathway chaperone
MTSHGQQLIDVLGEQIRHAEAMLDALAREHGALAAGDTDALGAASSAKAEIVETLERLEVERRELAAVVGDEARAAAEWQRLRTLVAECKQRNDKNGALLKARADNVRVALKALRGDEPELYGRSGRAPAPNGARPLGTA